MSLKIYENQMATTSKRSHHSYNGNNEDDEDNVASTSVKRARLGACEVCAAQDARYVCPKCEVRTCCLQCVQIHKRELNCNGVRDRTKFIPIRKMTPRDFMSDYYFLEECTRYTENRKRDRIKRYTRQKCELPVRLYRLRNAAFKRGTRLRLLLEHFTRHKVNTTHFDWKQRRLYWRIEWIFVNATSSSSDGGVGSGSSVNAERQQCEQPIRYEDGRCDEEKTLGQLLAKYVEDAQAAIRYKALAYYQSAGVGGLQLLLRAEGVQRCGTRFYLLDARKTLRENLARKIIVEYPSIYVTYEPHQAGQYDIIDSDDDIDSETKAYEAGFNERFKNKTTDATTSAVVTAKPPKRAKPQKNLLFCDDQQLDTLSTTDDECDDIQQKNKEHALSDVEMHEQQPFEYPSVNNDSREDYFSDDNEEFNMCAAANINNVDEADDEDDNEDSEDDGVSVDDANDSTQDDGNYAVGAAAIAADVTVEQEELLSD